MKSQLDLQELFLALGVANVYFQPPSNLIMEYPCIRYERNDIDMKYANNMMYNHTVSYSVTVIDPNPNSSILEQLLALPLCKFVRHYAKDNLNHDIFNIYY